MWSGCTLTHTLLSATGREMRAAPTVKTLTGREWEDTGRSGGAALPRQEGQSEEVPGRMTGNQPRETPGAGKGRAGARNHKKGTQPELRLRGWQEACHPWPGLGLWWKNAPRTEMLGSGTLFCLIHIFNFTVMRIQCYT